jgi:hypothetical protein
MNNESKGQSGGQRIKPGAVCADWFVCGYACAVANYIRMHGCDTPIEEVWRDGVGSLERATKAKVDEFDMEILKKHFK